MSHRPPRTLDSDLDDLAMRLRSRHRVRLPAGVGWDRGTDEDYLAELADYWAHEFDWQVVEAPILAQPWESVGEGNTALRVIHQRAMDAAAPVVVLLHGWPDSVLRFARLLPLLTDLTVVVPALPGFPFAHPLIEKGMSVVRMAELIASAMGELGYSRYTVSAGDVGADVAEHLAVAYPERVSSLHLTNVSPLHAVFADPSDGTPEEQAYLATVAKWQRAEGGYIAEQSSKPHTLAAGLGDSPIGLAAWIVEKLRSWSDCGGDVEAAFSKQDLLTWICAYWTTGTIGTSFSPYVEFAMPASGVGTPTFISAFAHDTKPAPRAFIERYVNLQGFAEHPHGGHFASWEQPAEYAEDLRAAITLGN
ncbi:MAG: epoxide hydrolase family protein [Lacisediminihabitans sp.]